MTRGEFDGYLLFVAGLCLLIALFNAFRKKPFVAGAALCVAGAVILYRSQAGDVAVGVAGGIAAALLISDLLLRARKGTVK